MTGLIGLQNGETVSGMFCETADIKVSSSEKSSSKSQISSANRESLN